MNYVLWGPINVVRSQLNRDVLYVCRGKKSLEEVSELYKTHNIQWVLSGGLRIMVRGEMRKQ